MVLPTDDVPSTFSSNVLMARAHAKACQWAAANAGRHRDLKGVNWLSQVKERNAEFVKLLQQAKTADDNISLQNWIDPDEQYRLSGPIDGRYAQSHDLTFF